jgi:hypothetical protein
MKWQLKRWILPYLAILIIAGFAFPLLPLITSQGKNLRAIDRWRSENAAAIERAIDIHRPTSIKVFTYAGGNGTIGIWARQEDAEKANAVKDVLQRLNPPRPIDLQIRGR